MVVLLKGKVHTSAAAAVEVVVVGVVLQTGQQGADWILVTLHTPDTGNPQRRLLFILGRLKKTKQSFEQEYVKLRQGSW